MMPDRPRQDVHIDLCGPFPSGESLLVCEDACTRFAGSSDSMLPNLRSYNLMSSEDICCTWASGKSGDR